MNESTFENMGGTYKMTNDYLIPELSIAESKPLGKWGLLRKHYLMDNHKALYSSWTLTGELDKHLAQVDQQAQERCDQIVVEFSVQRGITEKLKAEDQLRWVQEMNSARASAEEMVLNEFIYTLDGKKEKPKEIRPRFNSFDDLPAVLNACDLADALNISRTNGYRLLRSEDFPTLHIGRRLLVTRDNLIAWIKANSQSSNPF